MAFYRVQVADPCPLPTGAGSNHQGTAERLQQVDPACDNSFHQGRQATGPLSSGMPQSEEDWATLGQSLPYTRIIGQAPARSPIKKSNLIHHEKYRE
jgi:hypothetical protein